MCIFIGQFCILQPIVCESSILIPELGFQCFQKTLCNWGIWRGEMWGPADCCPYLGRGYIYTNIHIYMYTNRLYSISRYKYQPKVLIDQIIWRSYQHSDDSVPNTFLTPQRFQKAFWLEKCLIVQILEEMDAGKPDLHRSAKYSRWRKLRWSPCTAGSHTNYKIEKMNVRTADLWKKQLCFFCSVNSSIVMTPLYLRNKYQFYA